MKQLVRTQPVVAAGAIVSIDVTQSIPLRVDLVPNGGSPIALAGNWSIAFSAATERGNATTFTWKGGDITAGAFSFSICSFVLSQAMLNTNGAISVFTTDDSGTLLLIYTPNFTTAESIPGTSIIIGTIPLNRLVSVTRGSIVAGNASAVAAEFPLGTANKVLVVNGAGTDPIYQLLLNANIDAAAAIARTKIANGTASHVVINDGSGTFSSEAALAMVRGGFGADVSAALGFFRFTGSGTEIGGLQDARSVYVSFAAAGVGTYSMYFNYPVTISSVRAVVAEDIAGTDDATITLQDSGGTPMTGGLITIPMSSNTGTIVTCTPTTGNTPTAGSVIKLVVAKTTAGGTANVEVIYSRLTLS